MGLREQGRQLLLYLQGLLDEKELGMPELKGMKIVNGEIIYETTPASLAIVPLKGQEVRITEANISTNEAEQGPATLPALPKKAGRPIKYDDFFLYLTAAGRSPLTIKGYTHDLRVWERFAKAINKSLYILTVKDVEKAIAGRDINTVRRHLATLRSLARWYLRDGYPLLHIELQKVVTGRGKSRLAKAKSPEEFRRIRDEAKQLALSGDCRGLWLSLMLLCGLRISEIATTEADDNWVQVIGKGNKERRIPCPAWLIAAITKSKKHEKGGYKKKGKYIDKVLRKMGYTNLHSLRHTYATFLLNNGVPIETLKELLGHASIQTTQVYARAKITGGICEILET